MNLVVSSVRSVLLDNEWTIVKKTATITGKRRIQRRLQANNRQSGLLVRSLRISSIAICPAPEAGCPAPEAGMLARHLLLNF
jgi:hypothetical protein